LEYAAVNPAIRGAKHDVITHGEDLLNDVPEVRKGRVERSDHVLRLASVKVRGAKVHLQIWS